MSKDPDIEILRACVKALGKSSSKEMLRAHLLYLWDRFIVNPPKEKTPCLPVTHNPQKDAFYEKVEGKAGI